MPQEKQPAYRLDTAAFDALLRNRGLSTAAFVDQSGIADRTLTRLRAGEHDITAQNIRRLLDFFPESSFEGLFDATEAAA